MIALLQTHSKRIAIFLEMLNFHLHFSLLKTMRPSEFNFGSIFHSLDSNESHTNSTHSVSS